LSRSLAVSFGCFFNSRFFRIIDDGFQSMEEDFFFTHVVYDPYNQLRINERTNMNRIRFFVIVFPLSAKCISNVLPGQ
jgi:hypothetical protein